MRERSRARAPTQGHADDIEVRTWHWGVAAGTAIGSGAVTARRQYKHLVITKGIDTASTALLSALASNDVVVEAKLMLRKAGGEALDYYRMTLSDARVVGIDLDVDAFGFPPRPSPSRTRRSMSSTSARDTPA